MEFNKGELKYLYDTMKKYSTNTFFNSNHKCLYELFSEIHDYINMESDTLDGPSRGFKPLETLFVSMHFLGSISHRFEQIYTDKFNDLNYSIFDEKNVVPVDGISVLIWNYFQVLTSNNSDKKMDDELYSIFQDMISSLGELKLYDYLDKGKLKNYDINLLKQRMKILSNNKIEDFLYIEPLFNDYLNGEKITNSRLVYLTDTCYDGDYELYFSKLRDFIYKYDISNMQINEFYRYPLSVILAANIHQESIFDSSFRKLIKSINRKDEAKFIKLLPKVIQEKNIERIVENTKNEYNLKKVKRSGGHVQHVVR